MQEFNMHILKRRIFQDNFVLYLNSLRSKVSKFIDSLAKEQGLPPEAVPMLMYNNVPYYGSLDSIITSGRPTCYKAHHCLVTTGVDQRNRFLELVQPIEEIKQDIKHLDWYFGHLHLSMNSIADLYEALPTTLHSYLPHNDNQPTTPNIRDDKAYKILQEIKVMQLLLKN